MTIADLGQWISIFVMGGISLALGILSYRKNPGERRNTDSKTLKDYAEIARIATEGLKEAQKEIEELRDESDRKEKENEERFRLLEAGACYDVAFRFKIGERPTIEKTNIMPVPANVKP